LWLAACCPRSSVDYLCLEITKFPTSVGASAKYFHEIADCMLTQNIIAAYFFCFVRIADYGFMDTFEQLQCIFSLTHGVLKKRKERKGRENKRSCHRIYTLEVIVNIGSRN
jgi:hypothetical protein